MHNRQIQPATITVTEVINTFRLIDGWLREREGQGRLDGAARKEFFDLFHHIEDSIKLDNCDPFGNLEIDELRTDAMDIFEKIVLWADITCHEEAEKFRQHCLH